MTRKEMLLLILSEEAAEVAQGVTKALRFGLNEVYPVTGKTNLERLIEELNDMAAVIQMLQEEQVLPWGIHDKKQTEAKKIKVEKYLEYSKSLGLLDR